MKSIIRYSTSLKMVVQKVTYVFFRIPRIPITRIPISLSSYTEEFLEYALKYGKTVTSLSSVSTTYLLYSWFFTNCPSILQMWLNCARVSWLGIDLSGYLERDVSQGLLINLSHSPWIINNLKYSLLLNPRR